MFRLLYVDLACLLQHGGNLIRRLLHLHARKGQSSACQPAQNLSLTPLTFLFIPIGFLNSDISPDNSYESWNDRFGRTSIPIKPIVFQNNSSFFINSKFYMIFLCLLYISSLDGGPAALHSTFINPIQR
ncbi:MAG: hypothetical protein CME25_14585 [Gemmatimonadetes bacterium]|nr:hypothetical protein [Gemmatimonadota bacterium]